VVGAASGVGVRQLTVQGGCTRWRSAWGVVEPIGERLERAIRGGGNGGALGGERQRRKKGCSTMGVRALYSHQRRWTTAAWRQGNGGWGNGGGEPVGLGKAAATAI
jgi:hypothetical protein